MKKKLSLVLVFCLLICAFGINTNAIEATTKTDAILAEKAQVAAILSANPDYRTMVTASGEERILDADNMVINQIIANVDQLVDVDAYNNGEITNFFGVEITEIEPLFEEEWIDAIIEKIGYKFGYLITLPYGTDIQDALETLENNEHVSAVSQNGYDIQDDIEINIDNVSNNVIDNEIDSVYDAATAATGHYDLIGVSYAWNCGFVGSHDTRIAILDRGAIEHVEFENNMRFDLGFNARFQSNPSYGSSLNDVTPDPTGYNPGHGHLVAGIIGADYGDGGVNGICQSISMIPILRAAGYHEFDRGLAYSISNNAKVIVISALIPTRTSLDAIANADILVVNSAGNDGIEITPSNSPIRCNDLSNFIVVGNSYLNDTKVDGSNYSSTYVDLFAPGQDVATVNYPTGIYEGADGTSISAPMVAAAAALIRSHATHLTAAQTKDLILDNVDVVPDLANYCNTSGRLAIDKIVNALYNEDRAEYSKGDVSGDGTINAMDKILAQRISNGAMMPTGEQLYAADVNKDGVVDTTDVDMILGFYYSTCYFPPV